LTEMQLYRIVLLSVLDVNQHYSALHILISWHLCACCSTDASQWLFQFLSAL